MAQKITPRIFRALRDKWRKAGLTEKSIWMHYKGGVYVIDGFGIDTHHGGFLVRYHRVGGPNFHALEEDGIEFYRPPEEWIEPHGKDEACTLHLRFEPYGVGYLD